jgi:hypothetical protein
MVRMGFLYRMRRAEQRDAARSTAASVLVQGHALTQALPVGVDGRDPWRARGN